jgi:predicted metal-dependent peptidase
MFRKGERDHKLFNVAADIAINQLISNLPEGALFPSTFGFPENESAETYYELLKEEKEKQEQEKQEAEENGEPWEGPSDGKPDLTDLDGDPQTFDVHQNGEGKDGKDGKDGKGGAGSESPAPELEELAKSIAEQAAKEAMSQSRGNVPGDIESILNFLKRKPVISWKKELRKILSSRNGRKIDTIKRKNRRFPGRNDLRGSKVQKDKPVVIIGIDTSGSMDDEDVLKGLVEAYEVVKNVGELQIIQIDTEIKGVEKYDKSSFKRIKRRGYGGTLMYPLVDYITENRLQCDVLIMISDCYVEDVKAQKSWKNFRKPVLWLNTSGTETDWHGWNKHKVMDIHQA